MWSDIETSKDLLGYSIHASLLKDVITNPKNLPITVGYMVIGVQENQAF